MGAPGYKMVSIYRYIRKDQKAEMEDIVHLCKKAGIRDMDESKLLRWCLDLGLEQLQSYTLPQIWDEVAQESGKG